MSKQKEIFNDDQRLLEKIDQYVAERKGGIEESDSLGEFCTHVINTVPHSDSKFQESLETRLLEKLYNSQQEQKAWEVQNADNENSRRKQGKTHRINNRIWNIYQHLKGIYTMQPMKRKLGLAIAFTLVVIPCLSIGVPSIRAHIEGIIRMIKVGDHTIVGEPTDHGELLSESTQPVENEVSSSEWIVRTEIGNFGGNLFTTQDFKEAQSLCKMQIKIPTVISEEYTLREIKLAQKEVFMFYGGPGRDIIIVQTFVDEISGKNERDYDHQTMVGVLSDKAAQEVTLDGRNAAWVDQYGLVWEADGISYLVGGLDLSLDEAIRIAQSLR